MDMPMGKMDKEMQKKREAMKSRLAALGKNNPVVMGAMKMQDPHHEDMKWKNWQVVDELVSAARREYMDKENGSMKECVINLATALSKLASKTPLDKGKKRVENGNSKDEDY